MSSPGTRSSGQWKWNDSKSPPVALVGPHFLNLEPTQLPEKKSGQIIIFHQPGCRVSIWTRSGLAYAGHRPLGVKITCQTEWKNPSCTIKPVTYYQTNSFSYLLRLVVASSTICVEKICSRIAPSCHDPKCQKKKHVIVIPF